MSSWVRVAPLVIGALIVAPVHAGAQEPSPPPTERSLWPLPTPRPLGVAPAVPAVGTVADIKGLPANPPLTAEMAVADLRLFDTRLQSLFPFSATYYPADSLRALNVARAAAWLERLRAGPKTSIEGRQMIALAEVAARAEQDSLADRLYQARLAEVSKPSTGVATAAPQSVVLAAAVAIFSRTTQEPERLARNLVIAERYATKLANLPINKYRRKTDSTDVLYRQLEAAQALVLASSELQMAPSVVRHAETLLATVERLAHRERMFYLVHGDYPYRDIAIGMIALPNGRRQLDSLDARLLTLVVPRPQEWRDWPRMSDSARRADAGAAWTQAIRRRFTSFALLGTPAPGIPAHMWLNTSDSVYQEAPRTRTLADGTIRVLAFGGTESAMLPALSRVQQQFSDRVQVIFVTQTQGHVGPDLATPSEETAWLSRYYKDKRRIAMTVAVWAGTKVPQEYGARRPIGSPAWSQYHVLDLRGACVLVDGRGVVRAYLDLRTYQDEVRLVRRLDALMEEASGTASHAGAARP